MASHDGRRHADWLSRNADFETQDAAGDQFLEPGLVQVEEFVTGIVRDPVLARDAQRVGAVYVVMPVSSEDLPGLVAEQLRRQGGDGRGWPRAYPSARVLIAIGEAQAELVDVSYGGCQLELTGATAERLPRRVTLRVAPERLSVHGRLAWTAPRAAADVIACGVSVAEANPRTLAAWRQWVDHVSA